MNPSFFDSADLTEDALPPTGERIYGAALQHVGDDRDPALIAGKREVHHASTRERLSLVGFWDNATARPGCLDHLKYQSLGNRRPPHVKG